MALHTLAFQQAFIRGIQLEATKLNHETKPDNELSYEVQLKIIELRVRHQADILCSFADTKNLHFC